MGMWDGRNDCGLLVEVMHVMGCGALCRDLFGQGETGRAVCVAAVSVSVTIP